MEVIRFRWGGETSLLSELKMPFSSATVQRAAHSRPISLVLWRPDGSGLRIRSEMVDLAARTEVGVLTFDLVNKEFVTGEHTVLSSAFSSSIEIEKLLIVELGTAVESGIKFKGAGDSNILVLAGANPHSIAVRGVSEEPYTFEPEYVEGMYRVVPFV